MESPKNWFPVCRMDRVILHWTEGWRVANSVDLKAYHFLIQEPRGAPGTAEVLRGTRSVAANVTTRDGDYAMHTRGLNTRSIGVALCGMVGCVERPRRVGKAPFTEQQYVLMYQLVARICRAYDIPVKPTTVLAHGEVQKTLGVRQDGKWDPMFFPWKPFMSQVDVMAQMRKDISLEYSKL